MSRNLLNFHDQCWNSSVLVLNQMARRGIALDVPYLERRYEQAIELQHEQEARLNNWASDYLRQLEKPEINWGSSVQVAAFLYDFKALPIPKVEGTLTAVKQNRKRKRSTSQASIDWLAKNVKSATARDMLRAYQKRNKMRTVASYIRSWVDSSVNGRVHTTYNPATDTGRLSSSNINLQNIPSRNDKLDVRRGFRAAKGKLLIVADYSQLEMYIMAHFLLYYFNDPVLADMLAAGDVHSNTAFKVWPVQLAALGATPENIKEVAKKYRNDAKTLNYAMPYGKTASGLGMQITDENGLAIGKQAAQGIIDDYFEAIPSMDRLFEEWRSEARETGMVRTLLGRNRPLPKAASDDIWERRAAERQAVNTPVQGSAADVVTMAMLRCTGAFPLLAGQKEVTADLILQVHDELVFEVDACDAEEQCARIKNIMENPFEQPLRLQLKADTGIAETWSEGKA